METGIYSSLCSNKGFTISLIIFKYISKIIALGILGFKLFQVNDTSFLLLYAFYYESWSTFFGNIHKLEKPIEKWIKEMQKKENQI